MHRCTIDPARSSCKAWAREGWIQRTSGISSLDDCSCFLGVKRNKTRMKGYGFLQIVDHKPTEFLLSLKEIVMFLRILILDFKVNFFFLF